MVARIEIKPEGKDWTFERNVMPGTSCGISDPLMDGGEEIIAVICDENDEKTTIARIQAVDYIINGEGCVDILKPPDVTLRLGDPHYITSIQSQLNSDRIELRISHQDKF